MPRQTLRDYQKRGLAQILDAYKQGARSVLAVAPTGSGKTTLFTHLAHEVKAPVLINVHRRELATQAADRLTEFGVDYGFMMAGTPEKPYARVQVASVQTLVRRAMPPAKLVINDEAHLSTANTWQKILENYPDARILGVTATPWRLSGKPLAGAYDACVVVATPSELRLQGALCPYVGFSYRAPDLSTVGTVGDDYNQREAAAAMYGVVDNVVEEWLKHASDLSTVVFAVTVEYSKTLTAKFREAGVAAEHLDGSTPLEQRRAILARVERGETRVLCNVGVAVEGLDIPRLKCCVLARPTQSLARAIQMMGRVRRPWQGVTARIHDHAFVILQHGLPDAERDYQLNAKAEKPKTDDGGSVSVCKTCLAIFEGTSCPSCGAERVTVERELNLITDAEQFTFESAAEVASVEVAEEKPPVEVRWDTPGRVVEGVYERTWEESTTYGPQKRYALRGKRLYHLPGTVALNALMARAPVGALTRVTYVGEQRLATGPASYKDRVRKNFKVEIDDGEPARA